MSQGFLVRTNNAAEASGESKIGPLWQRFMQEKLVDQIPNRADESFTVVYSNYASDETGTYDYLLGAPRRLGRSSPCRDELEEGRACDLRRHSYGQRPDARCSAGSVGPHLAYVAR